MKNRKMLLPVLFSIALVLTLILPAAMLDTAPVMARGQATLVVATDTTVCAENYCPPECDVGDWTNIIEVAGGDLHTVGLKSDGTVVAVGDNRDGQCDVGGWTGINQTDAGGGHTVGLKSDGTVVAVGRNDYGQCDVGGWMNTTQVAAGSRHTVGLKSDGTVVAVGDNSPGQCNVGNWTDIKQVAAGGYHTVGLKSDGSVVATVVIVVTAGWKDYGQCDVGGWTNTTQVAAGWCHTVGLKDDGTVVAVGENYSGQCDVEGWTDIIQVAAGWFHTLGLKANGTVVAAGGTAIEVEPAPGCFIAIAAYTTPMAEEIQILRRFRDEYLLTNPVGQALVDFYYRVSPPIAEFITEHPSLKPIVRAALLPAVAMSTVAVNSTLAQKAAIVGLLVLVSVVLAIWTIRRRSRGPEYARG